MTGVKKLSESGGRDARAPSYGRKLGDFVVGEVYQHPWEVTLDDGMLAMFAASFIDPNPLFSSRRYAQQLGFRDRPVHPMVLMNLALSFSVQDVSEQTIAHLAYLDMHFPTAAYSGDTITVVSEVLGTRSSESRPDRGVVHVRTVGLNQDGKAVIEYERKALMPVGKHERANPEQPSIALPERSDAMPAELRRSFEVPTWSGRMKGLFEDFATGDVILHGVGRTVGESEHMQLTVLSRNTHPLHYDEVYAREKGFAGTRVVCGGLVFAWVASLASRDTAANALWHLSYDGGSHPAPVVAGDTLYAASLVTGRRDFNLQAGVVSFRLIGVRNRTPGELQDEGVDLFEGRHPDKVFEIDRQILLPKRPAVREGP